MGEPLLARVDVGPAGALLRIGLGAGFAWLVAQELPEVGLGRAFPLFLAMLFGIKLFAAIARKVVPASQETRTIWANRRELARYYDTYQWRKLTWFGLGMLGLTLGVQGPGWQLQLGAGCLVSGAIAEVLWRRANPAAPQPAAAAPAAKEAS